MTGKQPVIDLLQRAVSSESLAANQYVCDAAALENLSLPKLAKKLRETSKDERSHLKHFVERLVFLETAPLINPESTSGNGSVTELLKNDLRLEMEAVVLYTEAVSVCMSESDPETRRIFEETLGDEEDHVNFLEGQLDLISRIGESAYIQSYIKGE